MAMVRTASCYVQALAYFKWFSRCLARNLRHTVSQNALHHGYSSHLLIQAQVSTSPPSTWVCLKTRSQKHHVANDSCAPLVTPAQHASAGVATGEVRSRTVVHQQFQASHIHLDRTQVAGRRRNRRRSGRSRWICGGGERRPCGSSGRGHLFVS